jgi:protein arginine kinase activator
MVHVTLVVNGEKKERHLCQECAERVGEFEFMVEPQFSLQSLLAGLLNYQGQPVAGAPARSGAACPSCRMAYAAFTQAGRLGCGECYRAFEPQLEPILRRLHGSSRHSGKLPRRAGAAARAQVKLSGLREELERCVRREDYERAAALRDQMRQLEGDAGKGDKDGARGGGDDA